MSRRLGYFGVGLAAVLTLATIAFGQAAGANRGGGGGGPGGAGRGGGRGGDGLSGPGADFGAGTPAATLTRPSTPSKAPDASGFIQRWMVLEPIPASGLTDTAVRVIVSKEYFPDQ